MTSPVKTEKLEGAFSEDEATYCRCFYLHLLTSDKSEQLFVTLYALSINPSVHTQLIRTLRALFEALIVPTVFFTKI